MALRRNKMGDYLLIFEENTHKMGLMLPLDL
jgi:hypothetical protein